MGVFAEWQPLYAEHGLATFPVTSNKVPAIRYWNRIGAKYSAELARKFSTADAFGMQLGSRSGITVLDIDAADEKLLADSLALHGASPFVVRTASGCFHVWYRHAGEARSVRHWPGKPIDLLGDGYVVGPPSQANGGQYAIIAGTLDDLDRLPVMRGLDNVRLSDEGSGSGSIPEGRRNRTLFRKSLRCARHVPDVGALKRHIRAENKRACHPPLPSKEVDRVADSAWGYEESGKNFVAQTDVISCTRAEVDALAASAPDAFALLMMLRRFHSERPTFALANALAVSMGWTLMRFRKNRQRLKDGGFLRCVSRGGRGPNDPPIYGWP